MIPLKQHLSYRADKDLDSRLVTTGLSLDSIFFITEHCIISWNTLLGVVVIAEYQTISVIIGHDCLLDTGQFYYRRSVSGVIPKKGIWLKQRIILSLQRVRNIMV